MQLKTSYVNCTSEMFSYMLSDEEARGLYDLLSLYSPNGPIQKVCTYFGAAGSMPINVGHSDYYDFDHVLRRITGMYSLDTKTNQSLFAGGRGAGIPNMFISSIAETVERVLGSFAFLEREEELIYGTYRELTARGYNCVHPDDLHLFHEAQFENEDMLYRPFTESSHVGWLEGKRLIGGESVLLPAQVVELFYSLRKEEDLIGYSTSGGLASHINEKEALFHGLTELIERDAVNIRWNCRMAPEKIELDRPFNNREITSVLERAEELPCSFDFYLHSTDIEEVSVVTVKEIVPWLKKYSFFAGGGVNMDIDLAMTQALSEYGQSERSLRLSLAAPNRSFAYGVKRMFDVPEDIPVEKIDIFFKIVSFYGYPSNRSKLGWYLNDGDTVKLSDLPQDFSKNTEERFDRLVSIFKNYDIDPIIFDFTPPQLKKVKLMKAYCLELAPPYLHSKPLLGHPRYYELPKKLGRSEKENNYEDLVKDPLPYP